MSETPHWYSETVTDEASDALQEGPPQTFEADQMEQMEPETTGNEAVDAVVATLRGLDALPVSEHVAVFERAHESLRQVLNGAGEPVQASQA